MSGILERLETKMDKLIELIGKGKAMDDLAPHEVTEQAVAHVGNAEFATEPTMSNDPYAGVDKDGVEWDARIHSKAKEPKSVTTGKWKRKKGISDDLYNNTIAELKAEGPFFWQNTATKVSNTCDTRAEMDELLNIPTTKELTQDEFDALLEVPAIGPKPPLAPIAPAPQVPKAPAPQVPKAPVESGVKQQVMGLIKELTVDHKVEPNDITMLMKEVSGFDTIGKISEDKLVEFHKSLIDWAVSVEAAGKAVVEMAIIADANGFTNDLNAGIEGILEPHDADCVGIVHYSAIKGVNDQLQAYLKTWQEL